MLVIERMAGERVLIGRDIWVKVVRANDGKARLAIQAPRELQILREELVKPNQADSTPKV